MVARWEPEAQSRKRQCVAALRDSHPRVLEVTRGEFKRRGKRCHSCGAEWVSYEEKQADVNLAAHLVADVAARVAHKSDEGM